MWNRGSSPLFQFFIDNNFSIGIEKDYVWLVSITVNWPEIKVRLAA